MLQLILSIIPSVLMGYVILSTEVPLRKPMNIDYLDRKYWFSGYPEGAFSVVPPYTVDPQKFIFYAGLGIMLPVLWISVNVPELSNVAFWYVGLVALMLPLMMFEWIFPKKMEATAMVGFGGLSYGTQAAIGVGIALSVLMIFYSIPTEFRIFPFSARSAGDITLFAFFLTVIAVPLIEEFTFGNLISASVIEELGIIPGSIVASLAFAMFHFLVYQSNAFFLFAAFVFRLLTCLAMVRFVSFLPGLVAHYVVNAVAFFVG